jgi:hypothetical protein
MISVPSSLPTHTSGASMRASLPHYCTATHLAVHRNLATGHNPADRPCCMVAFR